MRKIIQLVIDSEDYVTALCDDGSIWIWLKYESRWTPRFTDIPQDNPEE